jgi:hypothetical protein
MTSPSNSDVQNLLPVQAYFNLDGSFNTFIGQGVAFYATANPVQSGLTITNSTINSSVIGGSVPAAGTFTNIATTTGTISTNASNATDIVNYLTLQSYAAGISWKNPVTAATTVNITLSGLQTVDTVSLVAGNTVLVKNQTDNTKNGIYQVNTGAWTYATGSTTWAQYVSALVFVEYGTQAGSAWYCTAQPGGTLGTTAMVWSNFSVASTYTAGTGLTLAGYQFSITPVGTANTYGSATATPVFTTNASGQVTAVTNTTITPALGSITGFGTGVATFLATPTSANLAAAVSDETGSGALVFANGPTLIAPALGTPASGVVTNLTGTASININGSVGATTPTTGAFTVLSTSSTTNTTPVLGFNASNSPLALGATISGSYLQVVMQNKSGTAGASTNWAVSNDLATDSSYYGEFGMNSSVFSASTPADFFSINNGIYFSGHDGDISIGSGNGYKTYFAWGTTGQSAHVINVSGAIGLNTNLGTTPALSGTTNFGTAGQVLTSQGSAATPTWTTISAGVTTFSAGTTGLTPSTATSGAVTLAGTLAVANGGTGITAFGTGVATALGSNVTGSGGIVLATSPTLVTPALGTPASGVVTNLTGTASININGTVGATTASTGAFTTVSATGVITSTLATGTAPFTVASTTQVANLNAATAGTATNATNTAITDDTTNVSAVYPTWVTTTTGNLPQKTSSTKLSFVPNTGVLSATTFSGAGTSLTGTAASLTAGNATTAAAVTGGYVSSIVAGTGISVSSATGAVTVTASGAYAGPGGQVFSANGTFTIPTGITKIKVTVTGGGGGAAGSGGYHSGGGGGGTAIKWLTGLTSGANLAVTIGGGGNGGIWNNAGTNGGNAGGNSTVASGNQSISTITGGGGGGGVPNMGTGNRGGVGSGGDLNMYGDPGPTGPDGDGLQGGSSYFGGGAAGTGGTAQTGNAYGGGGGCGGVNFGTNSAGGSSGVVVIEW